MGNTTEMDGPREEDVLHRTSGRTRHRRYIINIFLACLAVGLEIYYSICGGSCSYLKGDIFGINLEYVGIAYMACLVLLSILKRDTLLIILISAGVGIEFYLIGFQVWHNTYCPYCLAFAAVVFILFFLNFKRDRKALCIISMALSLILFSIFFKGSLTPSYSYSQHTLSPQNLFTDHRKFT
ncbi:MAG TPA: hypothetical protein PLR60_11785 [Syntrophorhabdaceae bacterium]|nr:hypothetical protein [Syntrophorhabdaceae bacterium]